MQKDTTLAPIAPRNRRPQDFRNSFRAVSSGQVRLSPVECQAFDYFRLETISQLPGGSSDLLWERIALGLAQQDPAVAQAIMALASIHRAIKCDHSSTTRGRSLADRSQHELALKYCNQAMSGMRAHISTYAATDHTGSSLEIVLILMLLLFSFETLHSQWDRATLHIRSALKLLRRHVRNGPQQALHSGIDDDPEKHVVLMLATPRSNMDVLIQTFVRLDAEFNAGSGDGYVYRVSSLAEMC